MSGFGWHARSVRLTAEPDEREGWVGSGVFGSFCAILLVAATAATSCGRECGEGPACGAAVIVTFRQPTSTNDDELLIEASFDDRVLRCRSVARDQGEYWEFFPAETCRTCRVSEVST